MGQPVNPPIIAFNRGLISPKALARVDLDKARLSASVMDNWLPKTQGAMIIRPGTKHLGSSLNDTGAHWVPFVASTSSTSLLELTGLYDACLEQRHAVIQRPCGDICFNDGHRMG